MRAFKFAAILVMFNLSAMVVSEMGIPGPYEGGVIDSIMINISDPKLIFSVAGVFGAYAAAAKMGVNVNIGSMLFAGVLAVSMLPFESALISLVNSGYLPSIIYTFLHVPLYLVFLYAFIQLSSGITLRRT